MAKQKGTVKLVGFIDGKSYYKMGNEFYVKNSSAPSKKKIKKDPAYKSLRENNHEFGASSSIASSFKKTFGSVLDHFSDNQLTRHLTSLFANIIHHGKGKHGSRSVDILPNKHLLCGFQFKEKIAFNTVFKVPYILNVSQNRKDISLSVSSFDPKKGIKKTAGATHFRLVLCLATLSDYVLDSGTKSIGLLNLL